MKDIENQLATAILTIQSIAQQRAENEIRKELGMPQLKAGEMEKFVLDAWKEPLKRHLVITRGGGRKRNGFSWTPDIEISLFKTVEQLPQIEGKALWDFARKKLVECDFDVSEVQQLNSLPQFEAVQDLLEVAVRNWSNNSVQRSASYVPALYFSLLHALRIMSLNPSVSYRTLRDHYYNGRKLALKS